MNAQQLVEETIKYTIEYTIEYMTRKLFEAGCTEEQAAGFLLSDQGRVQIANLAGQFMHGAHRLAVEGKI